jgi:hypothetical protein
VSADEARKQSTHHAFSGDCQFFFAVSVSDGGVHIGEFAGSPQGFSLVYARVASFFPLSLGSRVSVQRSGSFACSGV